MASRDRDLVAGLDLASFCGWSLLTLDVDLVGSGVWDVGAKGMDYPGDRWMVLSMGWCDLLDKHAGRIAGVAIERPSTQQWNTARVLFGQAAVAEMAAAQRCIMTALAAPTSIKKVATGNGRADKSEVVEHMERRFGPLATASGGKTKAERTRNAKARSDESDARGAALWMITTFDRAALARGELVRVG